MKLTNNGIRGRYFNCINVTGLLTNKSVAIITVVVWGNETKLNPTCNVSDSAAQKDKQMKNTIDFKPTIFNAIHPV